jgi:23S rRNA (guanosine2251-2'-O)-methyltransferase
MSDLIYGRNPVLLALRGKRKPSKVLLSLSMSDQTIPSVCQQLNIPIERVSNKVLSGLVEGANHQGVVCYVDSFHYTPLEEIMKKADLKQDPLILILDGVEDPVNFGSLIRTASCFQADGIVIGKNRQVQVTSTVAKIATGAEENVPIAQVVNISQTIEILKKDGYWITAADGSGDKLYDEIDYSGKCALIIGSEGRGISHLVLEHSDFIARIPISGPVTSLNAAISGAIFLAGIESQRRKKSQG